MAAKRKPSSNKQNQDKQVLYISPDEDVTSIRERLAQASTPDVAIVIPPQTHLRSHVAWRLLQRRAQKRSPNQQGASVRFAPRRAWSKRGLSWWPRSGESGAMYRKSMRLATSTRGAGSVTTNPC